MSRQYLVGMNDTLIRIGLSREEITQRDTTAITALLDPRRLTAAELRIFHGRITIGLDSALGDTGPSAIFEMPEVRAFAQQLKRDFPYWFFYFRLDIACLWLLTASVLPKLTVIRDLGAAERVTQYDARDLRRFVEEFVPATRAICKDAGFSDAKYRKLMANVRKYYRV